MADAADELLLTWLGQAGFLLQAGGTSLLVDAFLSPHPERQTPAALGAADFHDLDGVLATHEHWDHLDLPAWPTLAAGSPAASFVVPSPIVEQVTAAGLPPDRVVGVQPGERLRLGEAEVVPLPARHGVHVADAYNFGEALSGGACRYLGFVIALGGARVVDAAVPMHYDMFAGNPGDPGRFVGLLRAQGSAVSGLVPAPHRPFAYRGRSGRPPR